MNQSFIKPMEKSVALVLTPTDVTRLLHDDSSDSRTSILEKIATGYNGDKFQGREREIAEQVFRLLMKDTALRVRETLALCLTDNPNVPRDIVLHLAHDLDSVALPILTHSVVLSDADLVNIVEQSSNTAKLLAISTRHSVSSRVSDALVETQYAQVTTSLLTNEGAIIGDRALKKIADVFQSNQDVIAALVCKPQLPISVVERIIGQASAEVAQQLKEKYQLNDRDVKTNANAGREDLMLRLLDHPLSPKEIEELVAQMAQEDRLTPSIVMSALCRGQLMFFTVALAHYSGIKIENAERLLADRGAYGFSGLYKKSGLPESMMQAMRLLLQGVQDMAEDAAPAGSVLYANRLTERVIAMAGDHPIEYLPYFIALIRQNSARVGA